MANFEASKTPFVKEFRIFKLSWPAIRERIILICANRLARIDLQGTPMFIGPTVVCANRGQPRHSQFYLRSVRRNISLYKMVQKDGGEEGLFAKNGLPELRE